MLKTVKIEAITILALAIGLFGCSTVSNSDYNSDLENNGNAVTNSNHSSTEKRPSVVATTNVLCDLTQQVAAETVDLKCLIGAGQDPHAYKPKPKDRKAIATADLVLYGGYGFEPNIIKLIKASSNETPKVAVHEVAVTKPIMGEAHDHVKHQKGKKQEHKGEKHAHEGKNHEHEVEKSTKEEKKPDPHIWHDVQNGIRMVEVVRNNLEKVSPDDAQLYADNTEKITNELQKIDTWIKSQVATIPDNQRKLVATHNALGYYLQAYDLEFKGALEGLSSQEQPTAARIGELVKEIKKEEVPTIFAENAKNTKLM